MTKRPLFLFYLRLHRINIGVILTFSATAVRSHYVTKLQTRIEHDRVLISSKPINTKLFCKIVMKNGCYLPIIKIKIMQGIHLHSRKRLMDTPRAVD